MNAISWDYFSKVELRVGTIVLVEDFPEAHKPAYKLTIDFGLDLGVKKSSAQTNRTIYVGEFSDGLSPRGWQSGVGKTR